VRARVLRLWRLTTWSERFITVMTPVLPVLAARHGLWGEALAWATAGLWWGLYLAEKVTVDNLRAEIFLRDLLHRTFVRIVHIAAAQRRKKAHADPKQQSSVRFPRGHR